MSEVERRICHVCASLPREYFCGICDGGRDYDALAAQRDSIFEAIAHGDQGHRDWLEKAIVAHFSGQPLPDYVPSSKEELAAQRDEGLAREAELNRRISALEGDGSWGEMALTVKVDVLQQRLAEAGKLLRRARKHCDWNRHPLPQAIDAFLASRGCADGEKAE